MSVSSNFVPEWGPYVRNISFAGIIFGLVIVIFFLTFITVRYIQLGKNYKKLLKNILVKRAIRDLYFAIALVTLSGLTIIFLYFKFDYPI